MGFSSWKRPAQPIALAPQQQQEEAAPAAPAAAVPGRSTVDVRAVDRAGVLEKGRIEDLRVDKTNRKAVEGERRLYASEPALHTGAWVDPALAWAAADRRR